MYEITMAYAYWKSDKHKQHAVFDLFFRKNPFGGEFTVFAGLEECIKFLQGFRYSQDGKNSIRNIKNFLPIFFIVFSVDSDINYLKTILPPNVETEFYDYLSKITAKDVTMYAIAEGTVVFPKVPLIRVEGPLLVVQLLETTLLNLVNYAR